MAAEGLAKAFPAARIVHASNAVFAQVLAESAGFGNGQAVPAFVAGDDAQAGQMLSASRALSAST